MDKCVDLEENDASKVKLGLLHVALHDELDDISFVTASVRVLVWSKQFVH